MNERPVRVLGVFEAEGTEKAVARIVAEEGAAFSAAASIDDAVSAASAVPFDIAFVDLRAEGGSALALCHHIPSVCPGVAVHAIVRTEEIARGEEALALGAAGIIVWPPTGDAVARVISDLRLERARRSQVDLLEQKLTRERRRLETYDRLVRFARGAAPSDAVRAIVEGVSQLSHAGGVALYATFGKPESERVRLAALGSALDLPASALPADLSRLIQARHARVVPLVAASGELGLLVLDRAPEVPEGDIVQLADLAGAMLALVDRQDHADEGTRIFPSRHFRAVAERMLTLAGRHDRRAAVLAVTIPGDKPQRREDAAREISDVVRATDALCGSEEGDLLVFLPETTGLGAHVCRRRILARLSGERRSRSRGGGGVVRAHEPRSKTPPICVGVATFPHDGANLKRLVRAARARAADDARSSVHALALDGLGLSEIVDALIARPILDAGPRSPYPLDIACSALFSLVARACKEGMRGGEATVLTSLRPGLGVAAAARQVATPRVLDVRSSAGCEDIEAIVVEAEHGAWVCCGRVVGDRFRGVHAADPLLADVLAQRLSSIGASHAG